MTQLRIAHVYFILSQRSRTARSRCAAARRSYRSSLRSSGSTRRMASADRSGSCDGIVAKASMELGTMVSSVKRVSDSDQLGHGELRRIELSERRRALNQGKLGPPHAREVKLGLRDSAGA